jgi:hypothetical protein
MKVQSVLRSAVAVLLLTGAAGVASAQYGQYEQGYGNPYRDQRGPAEYASRAGFQDGLNDGGRDRMTGHSFRPTHDSNYKHAPEYGHPGMSRDEYKNIYRDAYVRGYERGYNSR